mmetsp:Transcript_21743/g.51333  ORF Transcript_21743/g.51333 Transcript_21743/m.51333 type:complete len:220 (+) Transcript_21743:105-764(+)
MMFSNKVFIAAILAVAAAAVNVDAFTMAPLSSTTTTMLKASSNEGDVDGLDSRRSMLAKGFATLMGVGVAVAPQLLMDVQPASATAAKTGLGSPFTGSYDDPNHPNCLREVKVVGAPLKGDGTRSKYPVIEVIGWDGDGSSGNMCKSKPTRDQLWKVTGSVKSTDQAIIDFSSKGGPANLAAKFEDGGIVFPDGNKWTKLAPFAGQDRLPKDMSTLKSE